MLSNAPYNYEALNLIYGTVSPSITKYNSAVFRFWIRSLYDRMASKIVFDLPENWQGDVYSFFKACLYACGFIVIGYDEEYGYFFQPCGLKGRDFYYQPTDAVISNPKMRRTLKLHTDGELLRLTPDYMGTLDIVHRYAQELAQMSSALDVSIHNSKMAYMLAGRNKASVNALKKMMDLIAQGNPAVYLDKELLNDRTDKDSPFQLIQPVLNVKQNYIISDLIKDMQTLISDFDAEIGIQSIPYQKAERMTEFESKSKGNDASARLAVWQECLDQSIDQVKKLFPDLKLSYNIRKEMQEDGNGETVPDGADAMESTPV